MVSVTEAFTWQLLSPSENKCGGIESGTFPWAHSQHIDPQVGSHFFNEQLPVSQHARGWVCPGDNHGVLAFKELSLAEQAGSQADWRSRTNWYVPCRGAETSSGLQGLVTLPLGLSATLASSSALDIGFPKASCGQPSPLCPPFGFVSPCPDLTSSHSVLHVYSNGLGRPREVLVGWTGIPQ